MARKQPAQARQVKDKAPAASKPKRRQANPPAKPGAATVFTLKITLERVKPAIWRRVQTKDCTLAKLHDIIQNSMGWYDMHLHVFRIGDEEYGLPDQWTDPGGWDEVEVGDSRKVKLSQLATRGIKKFRYEYDMGDGWQHTIQFEKPVSEEPDVKYPRCVAGARACPPEDCGGPWGYGDIVEAMQNPKHERHGELLEWLGRPFDAEAFNSKIADQALRARH